MGDQIERVGCSRRLLLTPHAGKRGRGAAVMFDDGQQGHVGQSLELGRALDRVVQIVEHIREAHADHDAEHQSEQYV